jgi:hypothetical protein|tara:strand:- start:26 stop:334 length:309 start_codon:yes stop_codon:yes gene_type:complete
MEIQVAVVHVLGRPNEDGEQTLRFSVVFLASAHVRRDATQRAALQLAASSIDENKLSILPVSVQIHARRSSHIGRHRRFANRRGNRWQRCQVIGAHEAPHVQ